MRASPSILPFVVFSSLLFCAVSCGGDASHVSNVDDAASGGSGGIVDAAGGSDGAGSGGADQDGSGGGTGGLGQAVGGADSAGSGGHDGVGGSAEGTGGGAACGVTRMAPRGARSASFAGTDQDYSRLYELACSVNSDCVAPCTDLGGSAWFCDAHVCIDSEPDYCLPPTKWRSVEQALVPSDSIDYAAVTSLGTSNGPMQDRLILEDFHFNVPDSSRILGIEVEVRRAGDDYTTVIDYAVQLVKGGEEVGNDYGTTDSWSPELESVFYGGPGDLWGEAWTPTDINDAQFGVAIGALPDGGGRAYIDIAYITVHTDCE